MPKIDYSKIPYKPKKSNREYIGKNAFYLVDKSIKPKSTEKYFAKVYSNLSLDCSPYIMGKTINIPTIEEKNKTKKRTK